MGKQELIQTDHFKTMEELINTIKFWKIDNDYAAYCRFFDIRCAFELVNKIEKQQTEINELKNKLCQKINAEGHHQVQQWKKIAEFLADKGNFDHYSYCESNIFSCNAKTPKKTCKQCIIDWAKSEMLKRGNSYE